MNQPSNNEKNPTKDVWINGGLVLNALLTFPGLKDHEINSIDKLVEQLNVHYGGFLRSID
jgi:hypothetical protein